jgi:hypothetical protein
LVASDLVTADGIVFICWSVITILEVGCFFFGLITNSLWDQTIWGNSVSTMKVYMWLRLVLDVTHLTPDPRLFISSSLNPLLIRLPW